MKNKRNEQATVVGYRPAPTMWPQDTGQEVEGRAEETKTFCGLMWDWNYSSESRWLRRSWLPPSDSRDMQWVRTRTEVNSQCVPHTNRREWETHQHQQRDQNITHGARVQTGFVFFSYKYLYSMCRSTWEYSVPPPKKTSLTFQLHDLKRRTEIIYS